MTTGTSSAMSHVRSSPLPWAVPAKASTSASRHSRTSNTASRSGRCAISPRPSCSTSSTAPESTSSMLRMVPSRLRGPGKRIGSASSHSASRWPCNTCSGARNSCTSAIRKVPASATPSLTHPSGKLSSRRSCRPASGPPCRNLNLSRFIASLTPHHDSRASAY